VVGEKDKFYTSEKGDYVLGTPFGIIKNV